MSGQGVGLPHEYEEAAMPSKSSEWANERVRQKRSVQGVFDFMGKGAGRGAPFPVTEVDPETIGLAVTRWASQGYYMAFGLSADGGALGVHLHAAGRKEVHWATSVEDAEDFLTSVPGSQEDREGHST